MQSPFCNSSRVRQKDGQLSCEPAQRMEREERTDDAERAQCEHEEAEATRTRTRERAQKATLVRLRRRNSAARFSRGASWEIGEGPPRLAETEGGRTVWLSAGVTAPGRETAGAGRNDDGACEAAGRPATEARLITEVERLRPPGRASAVEPVRGGGWIVLLSLGLLALIVAARLERRRAARFWRGAMVGAVVVDCTRID